jgi:hypothetical protein
MIEKKVSRAGQHAVDIIKNYRKNGHLCGDAG